MTIQQAIATVAGAFIFPFLLRLLWGKLMENFGTFGGWLAAGFLIGTTWALNHGVGLIRQTGDAWIDMAFAAGTGLLVASVVRGGSFSKAIPNLLAAVVGGVLGGMLLAFGLA